MTDPKPENRAALVTGAGKRIGRAIATDLAAGGWQVAVHYNSSQADAVALVKEIESAGGNAFALQGDLADAGVVERLVPACIDKFGRLDLLVNNASLFEHDDVDSLTQESWQNHIDINLRAPLFLSQGFAKALSKGAGGNIINIIDQRVWKLTPEFLSYTVSKSGLWTLTQTLAQALGPAIRVNAIGPGPTLANPRQSQEAFENQQHATLLQRGATPEEIGAAVRFILDAPAMTGQMIALDGGQHLAWQTPDIYEEGT